MRKTTQSAALLLGLLAWYVVAIATDYLLVRGLGLAGGSRYALLGIAEIALGGGAVFLALRLADIRPVRIGWTKQDIVPDILVGLLIAILFAALQFVLIIPATGGAERSDIVANAAQIGETSGGLAGVLTLAILGSSSEELLFRGLLLGGIACIAGGGIAARILATKLVVFIFALSHGYQGWAGVVDTGLFGGLALSLLYWWRGGRLAAPIAAHVGWNLIAATVIFLHF